MHGIVSSFAYGISRFVHIFEACEFLVEINRIDFKSKKNFTAVKLENIPCCDLMQIRWSD